MSDYYINIPDSGDRHWKAPVDTAADLPALGNSLGDVRLAQDTQDVFAWNGTNWVLIAGPTGAMGIVSINSLTAASQFLVTGTAGTDFNISSVTDTHTFNLPIASATVTGKLSSADWTTFNNKQNAGSYITALTGDVTASGPGSAAATLATVNGNVGSFTVSSITVNAKGLITAASSGTTGNLTDAGTDGITVTGGSGAVLGSGTSLSQHVADTTHNGYLSSTDWNTFNGKQTATLTNTHILVGNVSNVATDVALSGDATLANTGSLTLNTVNGNVGSFTVGSFTVNAKGLITAASSGTTGNLTDAGTDGITVTNGTGAVLGSGTSLSQHVSDTTHNGYLSSTDWNTFNNKQTAGNYITALTGDVTATGPGSVPATLATVNGNVGSFGSSTSIPSFTVNAKGLITAASGNVVIAPAGTLTGTTLASNVVTSSLTSLGVQSVALNMGSHLINNVTDPSAGQDAATKSYVDAAVAALQPQTSVYAATTANIPGSYLNGVGGIGATFTTTATGTFTVDGTTPALGARILIKDQSSGLQNGIYTITTLGALAVQTVFTRALDYDTPSDVNTAGLIPVINGTVNALSSWQQVAVVTTIGTDALVFTEFTANPSLYLLKANNLSDVASKTTSFNNLSPMTTGGDIIYGGASGTGLRLANGSSGQVLTSAGGTSAPTWATPTTGTVTSVALADGSSTPIYSISGSPVTSSGTLTFSLSNQSANKVFSGPTSGGAAQPTFRSLVAADIPTISLTTGVSGVLPIANGGTNASTASVAFNNLSPMTTGGDLIYGGASGAGTRLANGTAGQVLISNGTTLAPSWSTTPTVTVPLSSITAAVASNTIANANNLQTWNWDTLTTGNGFVLGSTSLTSGNLQLLQSTGTAAASNTQTVLNVQTSGANGTSTQTTYAEQITNTHTGTASTNIAGYFSASGGTNNYAGIFAAGNVGVGITNPTSTLQVNGNGTNTYTLNIGTVFNTDFASRTTFTSPPANANTAAILGETVLNLTSNPGAAITVTGVDSAVVVPSTDSAVYPALSSIIGGAYSALYGGTGSIPNVTGVKSTPLRNAVSGTGGTITSMYGFNTSPFLLENSGTTGVVASYYGTRPFSTAGSTITNIYGLYLENQTPSAGTVTNTPYGIYQAGTGDYNYFGGKIGIGVTVPDSPLEISSNAAALPAVITGTMLHIGNADSSITGVLLDGFANTGGQFNMRRADGTAASPSALQTDDIIGQVNFFGYGATGYGTNSGAKVQAAAAEVWTDSTQAAYLILSTRPSGTTAIPSERMRIDKNGNVGIGTTAPGASLDVGSKTDAIVLPSGTTAQQPASPVNGMIRYNSTVPFIESYQNSGWKPVNGRAVLGNSGTASSTTSSLTEVNLGVIKVPASVMGTNGRLTIYALYKFVGTNGSKTCIIRHSATSGDTSAGTIVGGNNAANATTLSNTYVPITLWNSNSASAQICFPPTSNGPVGASTTTPTTGSINTANDSFINFNVLLANASDTAQLVGYGVDLSVAM